MSLMLGTLATSAVPSESSGPSLGEVKEPFFLLIETFKKSRFIKRVEGRLGFLP